MKKRCCTGHNVSAIGDNTSAIPSKIGPLRYLRPISSRDTFRTNIARTWAYRAVKLIGKAEHLFKMRSLRQYNRCSSATANVVRGTIVFPH